MKRFSRSISIVISLASLAFLTACNAGVAAQIGDTKIMQSTVQDRISEILSARRTVDTSQMQLSTGEELNRAELRFLLISEIFQKLAKQGNIQITQAMKDSRKVEIYNQLGGRENLTQALISAQMAPSDFDLYIQSVLISEGLVAKAQASGISEADTGAAIQQLVKSLTKEVGIKVNPQYGAWDPENADMTSIDSAASAVKTLNP